ncbi:MAG: hypothetical protein A3H34_03670 [Betaproteobacteria bacterium RIFCSPLOWO2_02_FULL_67_19]|nr:MAG: hypothetical protein A3H34_03670 [Betaproteobacteria bacterium RIFCSPLOWO2_02_FULL_67_19]
MQSESRWIATLLSAAALVAPPAFADAPGWWQRTRDHLADVWQTGSGDIYVPFRTHHLRSAYSREQIDHYQEAPLGFGYGRSKFDGDGDWQGLYAMVYQDSHFKPNYAAGYAYQSFWRPARDWRIGGGATVFLMTRPDILHYTPFPVLLPIGSVAYRNFALEATFVPGAGGAGNVLFVWGRFHLD